ncbi:hypothetical protein ACFQ46_08935 [Kineococcus sp. GCM10028916]|uniref:hypothetical protein n=1 Tax=Kineococcus sp. GCM10028916 TaxID=3273394 RepID=UPI00364026B8
MDQRVSQWWAEADARTRRTVAGIADGQPLPPHLAWSLQAAGLHAPSIGQGAYAQPPEFAAALGELRAEPG